jgi:membrane-bound lytic murein transglycosylase D
MRPTPTTWMVVLSLMSFRAAPALAAGADADAPPLPTAAVPEPKLVLPGNVAEQSSSVDEALAAAADVPDEPAIAEEIQQESEELESLRKAEEASKVQERGAPGKPGGTDGLGIESPIKDHVDGAPTQAEGRIALLPELDHDLARLQAEYDIPVEVNDAVVAYVRFFQSPGVRPHFLKWLGRSYRYWDRYRNILKEEGLPEDTIFLAMIESGFGNFAASRARAVGPWQFIGPTGKHFGLQQDFWVDERRDPDRSARAASRYLKQLYAQTGDWRLAWAGYNAGVGRIYSAKAKGYDDFWQMAAVPGRRVLREETKGYVPKLMAAAIIYKHQEAFGFSAEEIERQAWTDLHEVEVPQATLLSALARAARITERELIDLNPELRRACTPPRAYKLKIPAAQADVFARAWPELSTQVRMTFAGHVIRRGDTLGGIAARYGVPAQGILEMNGLKGAKKLRVGTELLIPKPVGGGAALARAPEASHRGREVPAVMAVATPMRIAPAERPAARPSSAARTAVRVRAGDTLWSISQRYGVELADLCKWNGIRNPDRHKLMVGARLVVYPERG